MSTRALIRVEGNSVALYKHHDGYPDATLPWLEEFHKNFLSQRGVDPIYEFAQLVRSTTKMDSNEDNYLGWGVIPYSNANPANMGAVYLYTLKMDTTVEVKELQNGI